MAQMPLDMLMTAAVLLLALLGAAVFLWRGARRAWRFIRVARATSFRVAVRRTRFVAQRQAYRCATDLHYYVSRLAIFFSAGLIGLAALILVAANGADALGLYAAWLPQFTMVALAALVGWMSLRAAKLARRVMAFRRRLRRPR